MRSLRTFLSSLCRAGVALALWAAPAAAQHGSVTGKVTDQGTGQPLAGARVQVIGTNLFGISSPQGQYTIRTVDAGPVELRVVMLGYASQTRSASVAANAATTADFALRAVPFALEEITTTAVGEQRSRELGNAITRVDAAKLVETAPVSNLSDVLGGGRVAGVTVLSNDGVPGAGSRVRVRGLSSASLSNDPLIYIDGVRVNERGVPLSVNVGGGSPSFLNDLNPEEIESIEIVKGPSAATLYGTQAANGVIRVTTKRGKAGPPKWQVFAEGGAIEDVNNYPAMWYSKGTGGGACLPWQQADGLCQIAGLSSLNVFESEKYTPLRTGFRQQYGAQVSGGTDAARYFVSADWENILGTIKMPEGEVDYLKEQRGVSSIPDNQANPSELTKASIRANVSASLGNNADVAISTGYINTNNLIPQTGDNLQGVFASALYGTANPDAPAPWGFARPAYGLSLTSYRISDHFTPSATVNWRPVQWLTGRATAGMDYLAYRDEQLARNGEACPFCGNDQGIRSLNRFTTWKYSTDIALSADYGITGDFRGRTSVGAQYNKDVTRASYNTGQQLPPGGETFTGAAVKTSSEATQEFRTLGTYVEQQISWKDKVFLTGAVRVDQNSAFGEENRSATYPKVSGSWVAVENSQDAMLNQVRLRAAYGESGQQPGALAAVTYYSPVAAALFGQGNVPAVTIGGLGNTSVKPERSREIEAGFDIGFWKNRVSAEFTYYDKKTSDALVNRELPGSLGAVSSIVENIGVVTNKGVELSVLARPVEGRNFTWDLGVEFADNANELVSLAEGVPPLTGFGYRNAPGYPLFGNWWPKMTGFSDANGDGVISPSEVTASDTAVFLGSSVPTTTLGVTSSFGFFNNRLRLLAQVDSKWGGVSHEVSLMFQCAFLQNCQWLNDPSSSLENQARAVVSPRAFGSFVFPSDNIRLREIAVSYDLPAGWAQAIRASNASVTLTGRNIALFTDFPGYDPEIQTAAGQLGDAVPYNFVQQGQNRTFILRINLGF
ncbi:MAG TPA: SusC/RagA family TonB-linked outer membrane protein [Gemmatimonadales bacterium]